MSVDSRHVLESLGNISHSQEGRSQHETQGPGPAITVTALCLSAQMLARLLKSSHPEDLRAANKLIKEMVQEVMTEPGAQGGGRLEVLSWAAKVGLYLRIQGTLQ